jgi:hypothetical protein
MTLNDISMPFNSASTATISDIPLTCSYQRSTSCKVGLYDAKTIHALDWPAGHAKNLLEPLVKNGVAHYVGNIQADIFALQVDQHVFPVIATTECYDNSYVCSPYAHYILYAKEYVNLIDNRFVAGIVKAIIGGMGRYVRACRINSVVYVNHGLFSTDLYPQQITQQQVESILDCLKRRFPGHAIIFRSLNAVSTPSWIEIQKKLHVKSVVSRYVYFTDTKNKEIFQTRILKSDLKLLRETHFEIVDSIQLQEEDCNDILRLYHTLYIDQHSILQPDFSIDLFKLLFKEEVLQFKVLKDKGEIVGAAGYFQKDGIMFCPVFGFDKAHPQHTQIYRILSTALLLEAQKRGVVFHQSAGASFYKKIRKAEGHMEYMGVFTRHLCCKQRIGWRVLRTFINSVAPRFMQKY